MRALVTGCVCLCVCVYVYSYTTYILVIWLYSHYSVGFHTGFSVRGDNVPVINKSHLGGSGGMLPQKIFEF